MVQSDRDLELIDHALRQACAVQPARLVRDWIPGLRIQRQIHRGGQAEVFEAHQVSTERSVVVKVFSTTITGGPSVRFHREVQVLGQLRHPNIVTIHDSGTVGGRSYVVMDLIRGVPLSTWARDVCQSRDEMFGFDGIGHRSEKERIVRLFVKVCRAINEAHLLGIIHRDLKPGNVLVDDEDEPHVLDFGLAKLADADPQESSPTLDGQFIGSIAWASPEQAALKPALVDVRTDVYSIGVLLYSALTGRFPYDVDSGIHRVLSDIMQTEPLRPHRLNPHVDGELETIILKCLAKEPPRRYQNAGDVGSDLQRYLDGAVIDAKRDSTWYVVRKNLRRYRLPVITIVVFVMLLLASAIVTTSLYLTADEQRRLAEAAEAKATRRAAEIERIGAFQASQLAEIDPVRMGLGLRESLLDETRIAMGRAGVAQDEIDERVSALDGAMSGADFTHVALTSLEENVFRRSLSAIESDFVNQPLVKARLLQTAANTLRTLGLIDASVEAQKRALAIRRGKLGPKHADTLEAIHEMGELCNMRGMLEQAEKHYLEALAGRREVLGNDHPNTLISINALGLFKLQHLRDAEGAEPYLREGLDGCRRVLGSDHPDTLHAQRNLASFLKSMGRLEEAESLYRSAVDGARRVLGDEHPNTLTFVNDLGQLLHQMNKLDQAEPLLREALEGHRRVLGREHPVTLNSNTSMGFLLQSNGRLAESEPFLRETLRGRRRVLGEHHLLTFKSANDLGWLLTQMGRLSEAESYFRTAVEGRRRLLGDEHHHTLISINNLAALYNKLGRHKDAVALLVPAEPAARRVWIGLQSHWLGSFLGKVGEAQTGIRDFAKAEATLQEAYPMVKSGFGENHEATLQCVRRIVALYDAWHGEDPNAGHDARATEWRTRLGD